jgi:hypothetical protein
VPRRTRLPSPSRRRRAPSPFRSARPSPRRSTRAPLHRALRGRRSTFARARESALRTWTPRSPWPRSEAVPWPRTPALHPAWLPSACRQSASGGAPSSWQRLGLPRARRLEPDLPLRAGDEHHRDSATETTSREAGCVRRRPARSRADRRRPSTERSFWSGTRDSTATSSSGSFLESFARPQIRPSREGRAPRSHQFPTSQRSAAAVRAMFMAWMRTIRKPGTSSSSSGSSPG